MAEAETYLDVLPYIHAAINKFRAIKGGDWQELKSIASEHFVHAFRSFKDDMDCEFTTWLTFVIGKGLLSSLRRDAKWAARNKVTEDLSEAPEVRSEFNLQEFIEGLSKDAQVIVRLVTDNRITRVRKGGEEEAYNPYVIKVVLRKLLTKWGWTRKRIAATFNEIGKALR